MTVDYDPIRADFNFAKGTGKRCPESEEGIAKDSEMAYIYAKEVIGGKWPMGEKAILEARDFAYPLAYARDILKARWPEAEERLKNHSDGAYYYALDVIGGRWPEAEDAIRKHRDWKWYLHFILHNEVYDGKTQDERKWSWIHSCLNENLIEILNTVGMNGQMQVYILEHRPDLAGRIKKVFPELKERFQHELEMAGVDL